MQTIRLTTVNKTHLQSKIHAYFMPHKIDYGVKSRMCIQCSANSENLISHTTVRAQLEQIACSHIHRVSRSCWEE